MITDKVIKEIYRKFSKPCTDRSELRLDYFTDLLKHHNIRIVEDEIIMDNLEEFNPFKRFLLRSVNAILEFDRMVAIVFRNHIIFLGKRDNQMRIHMKPERSNSLFDRIFGRDN